MNGAWKKLCLQFVYDIKGFTETMDNVAQKVNLMHSLQLEVEVDDVEMLLESHAEELSNHGDGGSEGCQGGELGMNSNCRTSKENYKQGLGQGLQAF